MTIKSFLNRQLSQLYGVEILITTAHFEVTQKRILETLFYISTPRWGQTVRNQYLHPTFLSYKH